MEKDYQLYDQMCNAVIVNLYTLGKDEHIIRLTKFNPKDESHLALLHLVYIYKEMNGIRIEISGKWSGFKEVKKFGLVWKWRRPTAKNTTFDQLINFVEKGFDKPGALKEIYNEYYK